MGESYGERRAIAELTSIFSCQWPNGMLPHIRFEALPAGHRPYRPDARDWGVPRTVSGDSGQGSGVGDQGGSRRMSTSGITQPPVIGACVWDVYGRLGAEARERYRERFVDMTFRLERYHAWLLSERDPLGENLVACVHPWETGMDNSPAFAPLIDAARRYVAQGGRSMRAYGFERADISHVASDQRPTGRDYEAYFGLIALFRTHKYNGQAVVEASPFLLQDVMFNTLLSASLADTAKLQVALAGSESLDEQTRSRLRASARDSSRAAEAVANAIRRKLWDEEAGYFYGYDMRGESLLRTPTVASFMPLLGNVASEGQAERLLARLREPGGFAATFPIPSTIPSSPEFDPVRYWSGPSWPVTNWLVWRGLRERGHALAADIRSSTLDMTSEGVTYEEVAHAAMSVMRANSAGEGGEEYTTPSTRQYRHAWLWDSAITAVAWPRVREEPPPHDLRPGRPGFWEYYQPLTGEPLGAAYMTWTAAVFLDMLANGHEAS